MFKLFVRCVLLGLVILVSACSPANTPTPIPPTPTEVIVRTSTPVVTAAATRTNTPTLPPSPTPLISPTPGPKQNLLAAFDAALAKIKTFRVKVITDASRQDDPERIIEVIMPDRFRQIQENDVRQIGNKVYMVNPDLGSRTLPGLLPFFQRIHLPWYRTQLAQAAQASFLGRSVIDNTQLIGYQTTVQYQYFNTSDRATFGKIIDAPTKVWFLASNGYPVRIEVGQPILYINIYYDINAKIDEIGPP